MEIIGYLASVLIGISLGLIGGGGSILTVPVLVYLFGMNPMLATSYSLFIVGSTSFMGAINKYRKGDVNIRAALFFGSASVVTVFLTRTFLIPIIPQTITFGGYSITASFLTMFLFGLLMLVASLYMILDKKKAVVEEECSNCLKFFSLLKYGIGIGLVTGILGAGGGFLLIPALVYFAKLPMQKAVGTSLLIIAFNSLMGFAGDLGHFVIDWTFLSVIATLAILGGFLGGLLSRKISGDKLKKGFGYFVLSMALYILFKELRT